jgi:hypothetical protein
MEMMHESVLMLMIALPTCKRAVLRFEKGHRNGALSATCPALRAGVATPMTSMWPLIALLWTTGLTAKRNLRKPMLTFDGCAPYPDVTPLAVLGCRLVGI